MQELAAEALGIRVAEVAVASTGVIGVRLPMDRISAGIRAAAGGLGGDGFAEAIMTTDTREKEAVARVEVGGRTVTVGGTAKGSGMIHPNMGTMLAFLTTDAAVEKECLEETLRLVTDRTFNRVTVDGDTSPSDMALLMANGAAGNDAAARSIRRTIPSSPGPSRVWRASWRRRSRATARGRPGSSRSSSRARRTRSGRRRWPGASSGATSSRRRSSGKMPTGDASSRRMGYSGVDFDPEGVDLWFGPIKVFSDGEPVPHEEAEANATLAGGEVRITARLGEGTASATAWGCDLSYEYVRINGSYRT